MKQVWDGLLYLARSLCAYLLFYGLLRLYDRISGVSLWMYLLGVMIGLELLGLFITWTMRKVLAFDPRFMERMPLLVYALYRMMLEFAFLVFLFAVFGFSFWIVVAVSLLYLFAVLRHSIRLNRRMVAGAR